MSKADKLCSGTHKRYDMAYHVFLLLNAVLCAFRAKTFETTELNHRTPTYWKAFISAFVLDARSIPKSAIISRSTVIFCNGCVNTLPDTVNVSKDFSDKVPQKFTLKAKENNKIDILTELVALIIAKGRRLPAQKNYKRTVTRCEVVVEMIDLNAGILPL